MPTWVNRTVLSGASIAQNGTNSHTCTFTPATDGNVLMAVLAAAATFTTPAGWSLLTVAASNAVLPVFTKTASGGDSSFTTVHNGSNWPMIGVVYEFLAGTTFGAQDNDTAQLVNTVVTGPQLSSLTGTYSGWSARATDMGPNAGVTSSCVWTTPATKDYDAYNQIVSSPGDTIGLTIAYTDGLTGATFNPSATYTTPIGIDANAVTFTMQPISGDVQLTLIGHARRVRGG